MTIPQRYKNASYADVPQNVKMSFENMLATKQGIYLYGGVGTGKTHITYGLLDYLQKQKILYALINTNDLFQEIRLDITREPGERKFIERDILNYEGILILDDIGAEKTSEWIEQIFYQIINRRYNNIIPTIFTSNLSIAELGNKIGDRTVSRIVEMCEIIKLDGEDRRLYNKKNVR